MIIELYYVDGDDKQTFTAPIIPMAAKRKYLEIEAKKEEKGEDKSVGYSNDEFDALCEILTDIVFRGKFTLEQLQNGASEKYIMDKLLEAVWGIKPSDQLKKDGEEGNDKGK